VPPERLHWAHLYREVVTSGLCTGCAGCVIACPHDVLRYDDRTTWRPWKVEADGGPEDCTHGERGCTMCTRACPRFRDWEPEADRHLFGRPRHPDEVSGVALRTVLARAADEELRAAGQDGGLVSAMLVYALEHDVVDAVLVSGLEGDGTSWRAVPRLARSRKEVLEAAGSRYTYSANPLAYLEAAEAGLERLALVGMSCQASLPAIMSARKAGKMARRLALSIGLLCSKTFDEAIFEELFEARYGIPRHHIAKINIKGVFQIWTRDGAYHEVPLKEGHAWTREGCLHCPDFAAEHADVSAGGIGAFGDWTLAIVRTAKGDDLLRAMEDGGFVEVRPAEDDPGALTLLSRLSRASRRRWPEFAPREPARLVAPA
jgi:coenzyme F420 hydrogenase subunit beta